MRKARKPPLIDRLRVKELSRQPPKLGVCWYTEYDWGRVKAQATDPERFEDTYAEWETMAKAALQDMRATGLMPAKVLVRAEELEEWCQIQKKPNSSSSRSEFVAQLMRKNRATFA